MKLTHLFEYKTGDTEHTTKYRRLYHLTDNYGLGISIETNALKALRQHYISTTYRRETSSILGRHHYHYKFILNGKTLAQKYGVFPYDHHVTEIGGGERNEVSANEAEIGIDTQIIEPLTDYLVGCVILSKPYTENQVLFLADINRNSRGTFDQEKTGTIFAVSALLKLKVPLYWQDGSDFIPLNERDYQYLRDIEIFANEVQNDKRNARHLDILDKLLDKYDIKSSDHFTKNMSLDKLITHRRRQVPKMMATLNGYFRDRKYKDVKPQALKSMLEYFMKLMGYGGNSIAMVVGAANESDFFHPTVAPVAWTGVLRDLIDGDIDGAIDNIRDEKVHEWQAKRFDSGESSNQQHTGTGMSGDDHF